MTQHPGQDLLSLLHTRPNISAPDPPFKHFDGPSPLFPPPSRHSYPGPSLRHRQEASPDRGHLSQIPITGGSESVNFPCSFQVALISGASPGQQPDGAMQRPNCAQSHSHTSSPSPPWSGSPQEDVPQFPSLSIRRVLPRSLWGTSLSTFPRILQWLRSSLFTGFILIPLQKSGRQFVFSNAPGTPLFRQSVLLPGDVLCEPGPPPRPQGDIVALFLFPLR